ncbi:DOT1-domain-containing protein [Phanerochaete sordida]|uniref:Histone-lysine N-methyltransferase, H3 lysine-79 specific n=1 Tax=Phanerochaete sordida TaxID=48140 RepID=A0A9P3LHL1_9APHY|nr:DOT1-domain-containing protein [Phanerochaete sordida]
MSTSFTFFSKPKAAKPVGSGTTVAVRTVVKRVPPPTAAQGSAEGRIKVIARDATPASSVSSGLKRKLDSLAVPREVKKLRTSASPGAESASRASSAIPSARSSVPPTESSAAPGPSRSLSPLTSSSSRLSPDNVLPVVRSCWSEEDGRPGPGFTSSEDVVQRVLKGYVAYFRNPDDPEDTSFQPHPTKYPVAELEYPNTFAAERFILLEPRDKDHYNPIVDLQQTLYCIIEQYLTPEQQSLFGTLPDDSIKRSVDSDSDSEEQPRRPPRKAAPLDSPHSTVSTPASHNSDASSSSLSSLTSISSTSSVFSTLSAVSSLTSISELEHLAEAHAHGLPHINYLRLFRRAVYNQDGPLFLKVMYAINALFRALKYPQLPADAFEPAPENTLREAVHSWPQTKIPQPVILRIMDETYQRAVAPGASLLNVYKPASSEIYGELLPSFVTNLIKDTGLNADHLFLDLGSGVGNVVLQASLTTGCRSYGIELNSTPAKLARDQLEQFRIRCRMWGLSMGDVELEQGDMLTSPRTDELIRQADVILVNNKAFEETLNDALRLKFLDLKDSAIVVSLHPFKPPARKVNDRNMGDPGGIFNVTERAYPRDSVSWTDNAGVYFLHRVDRRQLQTHEREGSTTRSTRSSRSRR